MHPDIVYPVPHGLGPGHCRLANSSVYAKNEPNPRLLLEVANHYDHLVDDGRPQTLVFSSECFAEGDTFDAFRLLSAKYETDLVLTRRPAWEAVPSMQAELIKHGSEHEYLSEKLRAIALENSQFSHARIETLLLSAPFRSRTVISTSSDSPGFLFDVFEKMLGVQIGKVRLDNLRPPFSTLSRITANNRAGLGKTVRDRLSTARRPLNDLLQPGNLEEARLLESWRQEDVRIEEGMLARLDLWEKQGLISHLVAPHLAYKG